MGDINIEKIPKELKELNQWVLWKLEDVKGKKTKVPYTNTRRKAITTNADTWLSFDEVLKKYETNKFSGIGFVFTSKDDYVGIDFDKCIDENGVINEEVNSIIERCNTYAELSQSKRGIHIITKGKLLKAVKKKIEMYSESRFFTFTGNSINDRDITANQKLIDDLYSTYVTNEKKTVESIEIGEELSNEEITDLVEKALMSKSGFKIGKLYAGEWEELFESHSEADQSLCNYLAFWLDKNPINIDKAFRGSGLYRPKWEREDYRSETINKAIALCKESYQDMQKKHNSYIWEYKNRYYKKSRDTDTPISNFVIQPIQYIECIDDPKLSMLDVLIITDCGEKISKTYKVNDFDNIPAFDKVTGSFATAFNGTPRDLKTIKLLIYSKIKNKIKAYSYGGMHYINNKWYFIDDMGCIDSDNKLDKNIILLEKSTFNNTITQVEPINKEQLIELSNNLLNFNSNKIVFNILGYIAAIFLKKKLNQLGIKFSHLFYSGEAGAGKSETLEKIVKPILCISNSNINASSCTKFAMEKILNSNNTIPLIIDEYKPTKLSNKQINLISNIARNTYDENIGIRGNEKLELDLNSLKGSLILVGEASTDETAVIERSLLLTFSKKESQKSSTYFKELAEEKELLNSLGKSLLLMALKIDSEELKNIYKSNYESIDGDIRADRVRNTGALILTGINLLKKCYEELNLDFEKICGFNQNEIVEMVSENLKIENLEGGNYTKSIVDKTIEYINDMFNFPEYVNSDMYSYAKILKDEFNEKDILCIRLRDIYINFKGFIGKYNIEKSGERRFLEWSDFQKQLQKTSYYLEHNKTISFKNMKELNLDNSKDKLKKCFKLDIATMKELDIDIDNIIEYVENQKQYTKTLKNQN